MSTYTITVSHPWFSHIKKGNKIVEGRLNRGVFSKLKIGDTVIWMNKGETVKTEITGIRKYPSFKEMLQRETLKNTLPGFSNVDAGVSEVYHKIYKPPIEKQFGVVAIRMKLQNKPANRNL